MSEELRRQVDSNLAERMVSIPTSVIDDKPCFLLLWPINT